MRKRMQWHNKVFARSPHLTNNFPIQNTESEVFPCSAPNVTNSFPPPQMPARPAASPSSPGFPRTTARALTSATTTRKAVTMQNRAKCRTPTSMTTYPIWTTSLQVIRTLPVSAANSNPCLDLGRDKQKGYCTNQFRYNMQCLT